MGSSTSKAGGAAASMVRRSLAVDLSRHEHASLPKIGRERMQRESSKDNMAISDGKDPDFARNDFSQRLHEMGVAQPNPTYSNSSTVQTQGFPLQNLPSSQRNATLSVLEAREYLQQLANDDISRSEGQAKRFADMRTIINAMRMRSTGMSNKVIEERLGLQSGAMERIGPPNTVSHISQN